MKKSYFYSTASSAMKNQRLLEKYMGLFILILAAIFLKINCYYEAVALFLVGLFLL